MPILNNCGNTIKLGSVDGTNGTRAEIVLVRTLDYESSFPNTETCVVYILQEQVPVTRTFTIRVVDLNDNRPFITNTPPGNSLRFKEVLRHEQVDALISDFE